MWLQSKQVLIIVDKKIREWPICYHKINNSSQLPATLENQILSPFCFLKWKASTTNPMTTDTETGTSSLKTLDTLNPTYNMHEACTDSDVNGHTYIHIQTCMHTKTPTYKHTCILSFVWTHTHTHTHTHTPHTLCNKNITCTIQHSLTTGRPQCFFTSYSKESICYMCWSLQVVWKSNFLDIFVNTVKTKREWFGNYLKTVK